MPREASHAIGAVRIQSGSAAADSDWDRSAMTTAHSVTPTTSLRIRALARFDVFTDALAHHVVTSEREFIDSTVSICLDQECRVEASGLLQATAIRRTVLPEEDLPREGKGRVSRDPYVQGGFACRHWRRFAHSLTSTQWARESNPRDCTEEAGTTDHDVSVKPQLAGTNRGTCPRWSEEIRPRRVA